MNTMKEKLLADKIKPIAAGLYNSRSEKMQIGDLGAIQFCMC